MKARCSKILFFYPQPVYDWTDKQYQTGVNAVSLYQSETMVRMDYLQETVTSIGDRQLVIQRATDLPAADYPAGYPMCMD